MDDSERDEILWRLDERTQRMDMRTEEMNTAIKGNRDDIDNLQVKVGRNTTIIAGITFGLSTAVAVAFDKLSLLFGAFR